MMLHHYNCLLFIIIPPVMGCARNAEENAKREFGKQSVAKENWALPYVDLFV